MRQRWIILGACVACVAALGLFVWLKPPKSHNAGYSISAIKPVDARTVRVQRNGKLLAVLEKRDAAWFLVEPLQAPAESFQVQRLLAVLEGKSASRYVAIATADLEKFELTAPQAELIINDQRFAFGAINNVTREQYVLMQDHVYPLELRFAAAIPSDAAALLRRSVLAGDAPKRFEFGTFTVLFDEKKWIAKPSAGDVSQDDFNRWVAQWREGSALRVEVADARKPMGDIHITLNDGRQITLGMVQTEPELIMRRTDLGLQYIFVADIGAKMIAPPVSPGSRK